MTSSTPSLVDLSLGRSEAERELEDARLAYDRAAYEHAADRNNPEKHSAVIKAQERISLLEAEIRGLDAAKSEVGRREQQANAAAAHAQRMEHFSNALSAVAACKAALDEAAQVLAIAGERRQALFDLYERARTEFNRATADATARRAGAPFNDQQLDYMWRALLQHTNVVPWSSFEISVSEAAMAHEWMQGNADRLTAFVELVRGQYT